MKFNKDFKILIIAILLVYAGIFANILVFKKSIDLGNIKSKIPFLQATEKTKTSRYKRDRIVFTMPEDYSSLSKADVLKKRQQAVETSSIELLKKDYKPNPELFDQIDSTKPWFGSTISKKVNSAVTIANPMLLVDFLHPYTFLNRPLKDIGSINPETFVSYESGLPAIYYTPKTNTIDVYYEVDMYDLKKMNKNLLKYPYRFSLSGLNARDFGYEYVKATSLENIRMLGLINMSNTLYKFKDYYGVGGEHYITEAGANNQVLPHQSALDFRIYALPARMNLQLYKAKGDKEFLNYNIYFYMKGNKYSCWRRRTVKDEFPEVSKMSFDEFQEFYYKNSEKIEKQIPKLVQTRKR